MVSLWPWLIPTMGLPILMLGWRFLAKLGEHWARIQVRMCFSNRSCPWRTRQILMQVGFYQSTTFLVNIWQDSLRDDRWLRGANIASSHSRTSYARCTLPHFAPCAAA